MQNNNKKPSKKELKHNGEIIMQIMENAYSDCNFSNKDFTADWLLCDFGDDVWLTTNKGREELIDGEWKNTIKINFNIIFSDGHKLTGNKYSKLLFTIKKIIFIVRSGKTGRIFGLSRWQDFVRDIFNLTKWLVLNKYRFFPHKYEFKMLSQQDMDSLHILLSNGGWFYTLDIHFRVISTILKDSKNIPTTILKSDDLFNLNITDRNIIIDWLEINNYYLIVQTGAYAGFKYINRKKVSMLIDEEMGILTGSIRSTLFFRQFETDFQISNLLLPINQTTEYPDQKTPLISNINGISSSITTIAGISDSFSILLSTHLHCIESIPDPVSISLKLSLRKSIKETKLRSHTPFMPINTGLQYLNQSTLWVHSYGDAIIKTFEQWIGQIDFIEYNNENKYKRKYRVETARENVNFKRIKLKTKEKLSIDDLIDTTMFIRQTVGHTHDNIRQKPSLLEAINILVGACTVCIGLLKPSRKEEIQHLDIDCLIKKNGGYYLRFKLGKHNVGEFNETQEKPIPFITASAIKLLQRLSKSVSKFYGITNKNSQKLFNLPSNSLGKAKSIPHSLLIYYLNNFCDYVNLPVCDTGKRWYIRIHEMRKWFLLLLFWSGRFDVLDAARWIAGHTDASHIYEYIEREYPGAELPEIEAEYAIERLLDFEETGDSSCNTELDKLYKNLLIHFNVKYLSMVPEVEWKEYVRELRKEEEFTLKPYSVFGENEMESIGINVLFVLKEDANGK
jgi:hypothetical protein